MNLIRRREPLINPDAAPSPVRPARCPNRIRRALALGLALCLAPAAHGQSDRATRAYFSANGFLNRGLYQEAAAEYRAFLDAQPDAQSGAPADQLNTARYGLAVSLAHTGDADAALAQLDLIEGDDFAFVLDATFLQGQLLYAKGDFDDAARDFRRLANAENARASEAASLWIECLHRTGKHESAVRAWREALDHHGVRAADMPRATLFAGLSLTDEGEHAEATSALATLIDRNDDLGKQAAMACASSMLALDLNDDAARLYASLSTLDDPQWALPATLGLARLMRAAGEPDQAVLAIRNLQDRLPEAQNDLQLSLELGIALIDAGEHEPGRTVLGSLNAGGTDLAATITYWTAKSHLRSGDSKRAITLLASAADAHADSPLHAEMLYDLGVALYEQGESERALERFDRVILEHPAAAIADQAQLAAAKTLLALERYEDAAVRAELVQRSDLQADAQLIIAQTASLSDNPRRGVQALKRWLRSNPDHPSSDQARYQLGLALAQSGDLDDAAQTLDPLFEHGVPDFALPGLLVLGDAAAETGQWDAAERWYRLAIERGAPQADLAALKLGLALSRQSRATQAMPLFEQASRSDDQAVAQHGLFELGQTQLLSGQPRKARPTLEQLLSDAPDSEFAGYAMLHLGDIAEREGDATLAATWYNRAAETADDPVTQAAALRNRTRVQLGAGDLESVAEASRSADPDVRAYAAIAMARMGECDDAASDLERLIRSDDLSFEAERAARYELLWCARQGGQLDAALELVSGLTREPADRFSLFAALEGAAIELQRDHLAESEDWLNQAQAMIEADGSLADASTRATLVYRLARLASARNEHGEVVDLLDGFAQEHADHELRTTADVLLGDSLLTLGRARDAAAAYERALPEASDELLGPLLLRLGDAHAQSQAWDKSRQAYERYLREQAEHDSTDAFEFEARFGLGWALENLGQLEDAKEQYARVVSGHDGPTAARAQFQIGECLFAQQRFDDAVRELLRVDILYDYPQWNAAALYEAGRAFEQLRKIGEARAQYREVIERFSETQWAPLARERLDRLN